MEDVRVDSTDVSSNPPEAQEQHHPTPSNNTATEQCTVNDSEEKTSCLKSLGTKRLVIDVLIGVVVAGIILAIVIPIVLTRKLKSTAETTTHTTTHAPVLARQQFLTKCEPATPTGKTDAATRMKSERKKVKMPIAPERVGDSVRIKNTYMVEFASDSADTNNFRKVAKSLKASHNIKSSAIKERYQIRSSLFSGASFTVTEEHPDEAIEMIEDIVAIYPVYTISLPKPIRASTFSDAFDVSDLQGLHSYNLTGVTQVHEKFQNFGKGVRVAVIDTGIYYLHPALGGCFGKGCKVEFGYDYVGDAFGASSQRPAPDDDPLDNCESSSHGTHVAGIIAANATGMNQTSYEPYAPFIGIAPQATLGAYRVFGCDETSASDAITHAIYQAYVDDADIINLSLGDPLPYPEKSTMIAIQKVIGKGVYVVVAAGNQGMGGLQTTGSPAIVPGAMSVASADNTYTLRYYIIAPDGSKIVYLAGRGFGGWKSIVNLTIVVHNPTATINDGCSGPSKNVSGVVVLFSVNLSDSCNTTTRCDQAAAAGAVGCLVYPLLTAKGSSIIPTGIIGAVEASNIISTVNANPSATYTFTNLMTTYPVQTAGTPSIFSSLGLSGDLLFKPQISGIGGEVYSTISPYAAQQQGLTRMYGMLSGTSMACPFLAGTLALFLASIGNPALYTTSGQAANGICRPKFSLITDIFQSTAKPVNIYNSSLFATAAQQGAGLVDVYQVLTSTIIISPSELSLNDTVRKAKLYKINVTNIGDQIAMYEVNHTGAALATGKKEDDDQLLDKPDYTADYAFVNIEPTIFELKPQQTQVITLRFTPPVNADSTLFPVYSGFVYVTNQATGERVHMSYAGVVGDYSKAQIIVRNSPFGFVTGLVDADFNYISDKELSTLNFSYGVGVITVTAWPTRLFLAEVVSALTNSSYGLIYSDLKRNTIYQSDRWRNVATEISRYTELNVDYWSGYVCPDVSDQNCSNSQLISLVPGQYKIRFSALKHFGNLTNPDDFELYYTPPFNLVY